AVAGGGPAESANLNEEFIARIVGRAARAAMDARVPAADRTSYFEGLWSSGRYRGRTYGIPWYIAPPVLIYNSELFKKAGLNVLVPPATEDAMIEAAKRVKDRTHVYGFMPPLDGTRLMYLFLENGLPVLSGNGRLAGFNSPAHVARLQTYVDLL